MTVVVIPEELAQAIDRAFPRETVEAVIERLLRQEIDRRRAETVASAEEILGRFRDLAAKFPPLSNDDIRRLREEGRP